MKALEQIDAALDLCDKIAKHVSEITKLRVDLVAIRRVLSEAADDLPTSPGTPTSKSQEFKAVNVTRHLKGR